MFNQFKMYALITDTMDLQTGELVGRGDFLQDQLNLFQAFPIWPCRWRMYTISMMKSGTRHAGAPPDGIIGTHREVALASMGLHRSPRVVISGIAAYYKRRYVVVQESGVFMMNSH